MTQDGNTQQGSTDAQRITGSYENIHPLAQASGQQGSTGSTQGIEDNHTIAQESETSAFLSAKVHGKDAQESDDAA
mgnify:FL=1